MAGVCTTPVASEEARAALASRRGASMVICLVKPLLIPFCGQREENYQRATSGAVATSESFI